MDEFRFKCFVVDHSGVTMKVGMDGVLLGSWASVTERCHRALDIGTGSGLIALMVAQRGERFGTMVDAVEIDSESAERAKQNAARSPWSDNIRVACGRIQEFESDPGYNLILSNPPFFASSLLPPDPTRTIARHTTELDHEELIIAARRLLTQDGLFSLILPYQSMNEFVMTAYGKGLCLSRRTEVIPKMGMAPNRVLMEFVNSEEVVCRDDLLAIRGADGEYTEQYRELTQDFYLKF